ncbi:hypothetical protein ACE2AJ_00585 [Aquihabitans daechungensis]|uniref:hypothetical protein n=1 Tax=Aquihabitans daechungensis TaxID=1052257 RepID=UPI003B9EF0BC
MGTRCEAAGKPVHVLPQTAVGDTSTRAFGLTVLSMADVGTDAAGWFRAGDRIVIDPGGPHEETAVVASVAPFQVVGALTETHDPMEVVTYAPGFVRRRPR